MNRFRHLLAAGLTLWLLSTPWVGAALLPEEASEAQRAQAELQARIDEADGEPRELLNELRRMEAETRRLEDYSAALTSRLAEREAALGQREAALDGLHEMQARLPALNRSLQARLARWIGQDLPFLVEERRARVASLDDNALPATERLERLLSAWRSELAYGRELDAWRGYLSEDETRREVDFLRLGRIGLYYLTPDGRQGAVWQADNARWQALEDGERAEVRKGLRIARDQRAPGLLRLPVSRLLEPLAAAEEKRS